MPNNAQEQKMIPNTKCVYIFKQIQCMIRTECAVKKHWIRYYDTVYERDGINYFLSIKNSNIVFNKFKSKNFKASKLSTYDFSTLYTTLHHHLIKDKLIDLINRTRENTQYMACFFHFWCIQDL